MALALAGLSFDGTVGPIVLEEWKFDVKRTKFFGVIGESEIRGGIGSRTLSADFWAYNSYGSGAAVASALHALDSYVGLHGTLQESGAITRSWQHVTFDGFTLQRGPFYSAQLGWLAIGRLNFHQLGPNGT